MIHLHLDTSLSTLVAAVGAIFAIYSISHLIGFWLGPYRTPLSALQGPPTKHWFFGTRTGAEVKEYRMVQTAAKNTELYGNAHYAVTIARKRTLFIADQKAANYVLLSASRKYIKASNQLRLLRTFFGEGLLAVEGDAHKLHRKVAFPAFTNKAVEEMSPILYQSAQRLVSRWDRKFDSSADSKDGIPINAFDEFTLAALDAIGRAGFNYDFKSLNDEATTLGQAFETIFRKLTSFTYYAALRTQFSLLEAFGKLFVNEQKELDGARSVVQSVSLQLVEEAKDRVREETEGEISSEDVQGKDLLSLMVRSNMSVDTKDSEKMKDKDMIAMVPTFLAAGHETTSSGLSWAAYALTRSGPTNLMQGNGIEKQDRLRQELLDPDNDGWQSDYKKLNNLPYLDAIVKEVLRLFSPVRLILRLADQDDVIPLSDSIRLLDGSMTQSVHIGKGDEVVIQLWRMNTDPNVWGDDAMTFRPERWLEKDHKYYDGGLTELAQKNHGWSRQATFTMGPRNCIGMHMAVAEMKVILATVLSNFEICPIELPGQKPVEIDWKNVIVTRPFRKGVPRKLDMPCRLYRLKQ